jgi:hypothetical protein
VPDLLFFPSVMYDRYTFTIFLAFAIRIRIGFNAGLDPTFYLRADLDPGSQINANPNPGQTLPSKCCKSLFERLEIILFLLILVNCVASESGSAFRIRIRIQESQINADPDPHY